MNQVPVSFATESFFSNNALIFVNDKQEARAGRYQIIPVNGPQYLEEASAKAMPNNFLIEELSTRLRQSSSVCCCNLPTPKTRQKTDLWCGLTTGRRSNSGSSRSLLLCVGFGGGGAETRL